MDKKKLWQDISSYCPNEYGIAGLMGNLQSESHLATNNLENYYEQRLHMTDEQYTAAVNNGSYTNFINDAAGYGLAQWTYWTRKRGLLELAQKRRVSIDDERLQMDYLREELTGRYRGVLDKMKAATSVREASDAVLTGFENPANQSESVKVYRAGLGQAFYDELSSGGKPSGEYMVIASALNVRSTPNGNIIGTLQRGARCDIVDTESAGGYEWGRLSTGRGWVATKYLRKGG